MKRRFLLMLASVIFVVPLLFFCGRTESNTAYAASSYGLELPTQQQIKDRYKQLNINFTKSVTYSENYSITSPYAPGDVSDADRQNALNALNFVRFVAGLPDDVALKDEYNRLTQAASLVNAANGSLSHTPSRPSGMSDELYNMGKQGAGSSNIAMGNMNIVHTIVSYMEDSDSSNISCVGHRRWILNPTMQYTGFGFVDKSSALYAFDRSRAGKFTGDYVAWPPKNMPMELYDSTIYYPYYVKTSNYAFSVTLGDDYDTPSKSNVKVTVTSKKKNKTWHLDKNSTSISEYLTVENNYYGDPKCIIFNVGLFEEGDTVSVTINGIYKNGIEKPISYDVNFFAINHKHSFTSSITQAATCSQEGTKTYTCTICGEKKTESIPKTQHKYTSSITKAASCTENGVKTFTCSVCKNSYTEQIKATGHKFGAYVVKQQPTTTTEGIEERTCSSCGAKEQRTIAKLSVQSSSTSSSSSSSSSIGSQSSSSSSNSGSQSSGSSSSVDSSTNSESSSDNSSSSSPTESEPTESSSATGSGNDSLPAEDSSSSNGENNDTQTSGSNDSQDGSSNQSMSGSSQSDKDNGDINVPLIVGISVVGVLLVGIAAIIIITVKKKNK